MLLNQLADIGLSLDFARVDRLDVSEIDWRDGSSLNLRSV